VEEVFFPITGGGDTVGYNTSRSRSGQLLYYLGGGVGLALIPGGGGV
jgi:hypothetical protein